MSVSREKRKIRRERLVNQHTGSVIIKTWNYTQLLRLAICLHLQSIWEVYFQTASHVHLESWCTQKVTVWCYFLWVEIPALSVTPPCCQYHSKWRNCWEDFVGFSEILKNCKQTQLHTKKASCKAGSWTWRSIKITDTDCNLNVLHSCTQNGSIWNLLSYFHFQHSTRYRCIYTDYKELWTIDN